MSNCDIIKLAFISALLVPFCGVIAQSVDTTTIKLSLAQAIKQGKAANMSIQAIKAEESAAFSDLEDAILGALPRISTNASYQRYSSVTLFDGLLGKPHQVPKPPNANAGTLGVEASVNLYSGGRQKLAVNDLKRKVELASIDTKEQESNITLLVINQYLEMIRLHFQQSLIKDQISRASIRATNINAFYANGKVTKSDVLRADVLLSNVLLSELANRNDYLISNQKLNTLLNFDISTKIIAVDTTSLIRPDGLELQSLLQDLSGNYATRKIRKSIELQENRINLIRSSYSPSLFLLGGYGFNYPNTLVFPPMPQTFGVGFVGVRMSYDISSLYQNKNKVKSAILRETKLKQQEDWITDNVKQEAKALEIKYNEAICRLQVSEKSIQQAKINYNIQNTKYANQLSLLTDLLEADNLYQESRLNYLQAHIAALAIYYRLIFITGKL